MLTPEQLIALTLKPCAVYKYEDKEALSTDVPHFFILINNNPLNEPILLLTCVSSKVEKTKLRAAKRGQSLDTLVELSKEFHEFLEHDSIVDCNFIIVKNKEQLIEKCRTGSFKIEKEIDVKCLDELQRAFLRSRRHPKAIKRIIDPSI